MYKIAWRSEEQSAMLADCYPKTNIFAIIKDGSEDNRVQFMDASGYKVETTKIIP